MIEIEVVQTIAVPPERVLDLVMDVERYAEVDAKIRPLLWVRRRGDRLEFACRPKLAGLRQPRVVQFMERSQGRIDIGLLPQPQNRLAHALAHFEASFEASPSAGGTRVTRRLRFDFRPWVGWLLEPLFRRRLPREVEDEIRLAKTYLENGHPSS